MNSEIIEIPNFLLCFDVKAWFVDPPQNPPLGLIWRVTTTQKRSSAQETARYQIYLICCYYHEIASVNMAARHEFERRA